jgi:DNA-directed RNA polymerase specialized sigma24 family protein
MSNQALSYEEVDRLVDSYKARMSNNDSAASSDIELLLQGFAGYITKWISILRGNTPNLQDSNTITFLTLMSKVLNTNDVFSTLDVIKGCYRDSDSDEIYSDVIIMFIECVARYERRDYAGFTHYLSRVFPYRVFRAVMDKLEDTRTNVSLDNLPITRRKYESTAAYQDPYYDNLRLECLSNGESELFDMYFLRGMSYNDIAKIKGIGRRQVVRRVKVVRTKILEWAAL